MDYLIDVGRQVTGLTSSMLQDVFCLAFAYFPVIFVFYILISVIISIRHYFRNNDEQI